MTIQREDRLLKAKQYITENISKNITRTEVANYLYLSEEYFSRWFSKETGDSFKNYLLNQKIEYAKATVGKYRADSWNHSIKGRI